MGFLRRPAQQHKMLVLSLVTILASSCISIPSRQRYTSFKNFPVVGIKENHEEESPIETVEETVYTENIPRAARQVEPSSYTDSLDDVFVEEGNERAERDGAHGSHGSSRHSANRNSRRFQQSQQIPQEQDFRQPAPPAQEQRGGRQTGQIGSALGVLSNPPSSNGDYNFNFSNDDGSSRQESGAPDGIRGS